MSRRAFAVTREESGQTVAAVLRSHLSLSWSQARRLVHEHRAHLAGQPCADPARRVKPGQRVEVDETPSTTNKAPGPRHHGLKPVIRFADAHVVVVEKPAGLTTMRHRQDEAEFGARAKRYLP